MLYEVITKLSGQSGHSLVQFVKECQFTVFGNRQTDKGLPRRSAHCGNITQINGQSLVSQVFAGDRIPKEMNA